MWQRIEHNMFTSVHFMSLNQIQPTRFDSILQVYIKCSRLEKINTDTYQSRVYIVFICTQNEWFNESKMGSNSLNAFCVSDALQKLLNCDIKNQWNFVYSIFQVVYHRIVHNMNAFFQ